MELPQVVRDDAEHQHDYLTATMLSHRIRNLISDAQRAQGVRAHTPAGFTEPTAYIEQPAAVSSVLGLTSEFLPNLFDKSGKLTRTPPRVIGSTTIPLSVAILANSRVAQAGAHLLIRNDPTKAHLVDAKGDVALEHVVGSFRVTAPAQFETVADDADVSISTHPALSAELDWEASITKSVRIEIPRASLNKVGADILAAELISAVTLGLADAADAVLLEALSALTLPAFSFADAAGEGLRFDELRALVGDSAENYRLEVENGQLRANGIPAELVRFALGGEGVIIGAWDRAAVAVHENVPLHFERTNSRGDLIATAFVNLIPLVPDTGKFWTTAWEDL